jgi:hypothetical protein
MTATIPLNTSSNARLTPRLRSLPGLSRARLDVRLQTAEEVLPAHGDGVTSGAAEALRGAAAAL